MIKFLGMAAVTSMLPKLLDRIGDSLVELYDSMFAKDVDPVRKKRDTTKITREMGAMIKEYHSVSTESGDAQTECLNRIHGLNKSKSAYARIWADSFDLAQLTKEEDL